MIWWQKAPINYKLQRVFLFTFFYAKISCNFYITDLTINDNCNNIILYIYQFSFHGWEMLMGLRHMFSLRFWDMFSQTMMRYCTFIYYNNILGMYIYISAILDGYITCIIAHYIKLSLQIHVQCIYTHVYTFLPMLSTYYDLPIEPPSSILYSSVHFACATYTYNSK